MQWIVIECGLTQLAYKLDQTTILMGIAVLGMVLEVALVLELPLKNR